MLELNSWDGIAVLLTVFSGIVAAMIGTAKVVFGHLNTELDQRFKAQEIAREKGSSALRQILSEHIAEERANTDQVRNLEREFLTWRADLPLQYVRREDYVRNQTVIEAKLDGLGLRLENIQLRTTKP